MLLEGRVAVVTGIGPGIGRSTALALVQHGADVALGARTQTALQELAAEIERLGRRAVWSVTNIADEDTCEALVAKAVEEFGRVDVLVQNAFMHPSFKTIEDSDADDWRRAMKVNVIGTLNMIWSVLPHMKDGSSIIVTNSMSARNAEPNNGAYAAAKAALLSMVRTLAQEVGPRGIRVNSVLPGWVLGQSLDVYFEWIASERGITTKEVHDEIADKTALRRLISPDDVAGAIVFLASDLSNGITGISLDVNSGHWFPQ